MPPTLIADILTGDSDEIADLLANTSILEAFIELARKLDAMPDINKRFYEESRSLYQATCTNLPIDQLETILADFFGPPVKSADKPLSRKLRKNSSVRYLGGIEKDQSLFLLPLKTGEFYGALWPWRRNKAKVEIHLGYCSDWMIDEHYQQLETLIKRSVTQSAFEKMDTNVGGQIHGIGLPSFLQMSEMEQSTFSLRITSGGQAGTLHLLEGQLIAAEHDQWTGREAAYRIIAWDEATIEIEPADASKTDEIKQPLMHVLMESLKIKDDITSPLERPPVPPPAKKKKGAGQPAGSQPQKRLVRLERAPGPKVPRKRRNLITLFAIALAVVVIAGTVAVVALHVMNNRDTSDQWRQVSAKVDEMTSLEDRLKLLHGFLEAHSGTPHIAEIQSRIEETEQKIEEQEFEKVTLQISSLPVDDHFEKAAVELYAGFMEKYPDSPFSEQINDAISDIKKLVDQYYYEELKRAARMDLNKRLAVYKNYLERFPGGRYHRDVTVLIHEMGEQHLNYLKSEDGQCEQNQRWEACIQRYKDFIANFEGLPLADEARLALKALTDKRDLAQLRKLGDEAGKDYQTTYRAYQDYLAANPDTTQKSVIEEELKTLARKLDVQRQWISVQSYATNANNRLYDRIQRVDGYLKRNLSSPYVGEAQDLMNQLEAQRRMSQHQRQIEEQQQAEKARLQREAEQRAAQLRRVKQVQQDMERQLSGSTRYRVNGNGTVTDQTTGLTWALADSYDALGGCIDFKGAQDYIRGLRLGGYGDWRMPSANELAAIYKQKPFFPQTQAEWYWTSDVYVRGYHAVADVVTAKPETYFQRIQRNQDECGAVRAVRP